MGRSFRASTRESIMLRISLIFVTYLFIVLVKVEVESENIGDFNDELTRVVRSTKKENGATKTLGKRFKCKRKGKCEKKGRKNKNVKGQIGKVKKNKNVSRRNKDQKRQRKKKRNMKRKGKRKQGKNVQQKQRKKKGNRAKSSKGSQARSSKCARQSGPDDGTCMSNIGLVMDYQGNQIANFGKQKKRIESF